MAGHGPDGQTEGTEGAAQRAVSALTLQVPKAWLDGILGNLGW